MTYKYKINTNIHQQSHNEHISLELVLINRTLFPIVLLYNIRHPPCTFDVEKTNKLYNVEK